ncbi:hypothetical protein GGQ61_004122 [Phenylobacterium haematophilum]|uniref:Uncharacterized protein n=1 Tax=Phenylobacterium haematophilum TaxID=98513 RepID=A0A840A4T9_9CAUL|nr:hypothetical protein [Phenylobacterium haematophilum]
MANNPDTNPAGDGETIRAEDASAGQKTGHMRWVLAISAMLAIAALLVVWLAL